MVASAAFPVFPKVAKVEVSVLGSAALIAVLGSAEVLDHSTNAIRKGEEITESALNLTPTASGSESAAKYVDSETNSLFLFLPKVL